jgi:hypothetical protein
MAFGLAVYASPRSLPHPTQNSLPVAGQALLDGILTRKVPLKGFKVVDYISFPLYGRFAHKLVQSWQTGELWSREEICYSPWGLPLGKDCSLRPWFEELVHHAARPSYHKDHPYRGCPEESHGYASLLCFLVLR